MSFSDGFSSSLYNSAYFIAMTAIPTFVSIKLTNKYMSRKQRNSIKRKIKQGGYKLFTYYSNAVESIENILDKYRTDKDKYEPDKQIIYQLSDRCLQDINESNFIQNIIGIQRIICLPFAYDGTNYITNNFSENWNLCNFLDPNFNNTNRDEYLNTLKDYISPVIMATVSVLNTENNKFVIEKINVIELFNKLVIPNTSLIFHSDLDLFWKQLISKTLTKNNSEESILQLEVLDVFIKQTNNIEESNINNEIEDNEDNQTRKYRLIFKIMDSKINEYQLDNGILKITDSLEWISFQNESNESNESTYPQPIVIQDSVKGVHNIFMPYIIEGYNNTLHK